MLTRLRDRLGPRPGTPDDTGFTLVELLVAMGIMTLVGAMSLTFFVGSGRTTMTTTDSSRATAQARSAMSSAIQLLQFADSATANSGAADSRFDTATSSLVVFYSNDNGNRTGTEARQAPDKISLDASGGRLVERVYPPTTPAALTSAYPATPSVTRILVPTLGSSTVFAYCSNASTGDPCKPVPALTDIASVTVTLVIPGGPGEQSQTLTSTAAITGAMQ